MNNTQPEHPAEQHDRVWILAEGGEWFVIHPTTGAVLTEEKVTATERMRAARVVGQSPAGVSRSFTVRITD